MNKSDTIKKSELCNIITPKFVNNIVSAIWWAEDNGWEERPIVEGLQKDIDKLARFCDIEKKDDLINPYVKK